MSLLDELNWDHSLLHKNEQLRTPTDEEVRIIDRLREFEKNHITKLGDESVDHPRHYTSHPSGIECIQVTEHMGFNLGNVVKYAWRCDLKKDAIEDLKKARWYLDREIAKRENSK